MISGSSSDQLLGLCICSAWAGPNVRNLIIGDMLRPFTMSAWMIGRQVCDPLQK